MTTVVMAIVTCAGAVGAARFLRPGNARQGACAPVPPPAPVPREYPDRAVDCLVWGEVDPPLSALAEPELDSIVAILARMLHAYEKADFGSFLALRRDDLEHARGCRASGVEELRRLSLELGVPAQAVPEDWIGALEVFWKAYYERPPVARFVPESTRLQLHRGVRVEDLGDWQEAFDQASAALAGPRIEHRLVIPHRSGLAALAAGPAGLTWMDLELGFESCDGVPGHLLVRFVQDGGAWFLQRAFTVYAESATFESPRCQLIL